MKKVFQFKITLQDIEPTIWRRIQISDQCTFHKLHWAIQGSMGWTNSHLYEFQIKDTNIKDGNKISVRIGVLFKEEEDDMGSIPLLDAEEVKVVNCLKDKKIIYTYDFGDCWEHMIEFEGVFSKLVNTKYPLCLEGMNACPPEDVGGHPCYPNFISVIKNKMHPDHKMYINWIGNKGFDPNKFDVSKVRFRTQNCSSKYFTSWI